MAALTKPIILNETYGEKMEKLISALTGMTKGVASVNNLEADHGDIELSANVTNLIPVLDGAVNITLAEASEELDCEWVFVIAQGAEAHKVTMPKIDWYLGIAPAFEANTVTEVRVFRVGDKYKGVWIA